MAAVGVVYYEGCFFIVKKIYEKGNTAEIIIYKEMIAIGEDSVGVYNSNGKIYIYKKLGIVM